MDEDLKKMLKQLHLRGLLTNWDQYLELAHAAQLHQFMARRGILLRLFEHLGSLRFGLPATDTDWQRLVQALDDYRKEHP